MKLRLMLALIIPILVLLGMSFIPNNPSTAYPDPDPTVVIPQQEDAPEVLNWTCEEGVPPESAGYILYGWQDSGKNFSCPPSQGGEGRLFVQTDEQIWDYSLSYWGTDDYGLDTWDVYYPLPDKPYKTFARVNEYVPYPGDCIRHYVQPYYFYPGCSDTKNYLPMITR